MDKIKFTIIALTLITVAFPILAQNRQARYDEFFPIERSHSYIEFSVKYMGFAKVKGRFAQFSGLIRYDEGNINNTSVSFQIQTESLSTDLEFRDKDLKSENWLDAAKYPLITFTSRSVQKKSQGFDLSGDLTIKGVTKQVVLHMAPASGVLKDIRNDLQLIFTGTTSIDRTDFGVEGKNWSGVREGITAVENEIHIEFSMLGKRIQKQNFSNWVGNPQNPQGKIYQAISTQGVAKGLEEFKKLHSEKAVRVPALSTVAYMLMLEEKYQDARMVLEANAEAFPESADVYISLGEFYLQQNDNAKAKSFFSEALKRDSNNIHAIEYSRHL
jgi:polyisoprenoid-binding protein YceI